MNICVNMVFLKELARVPARDRQRVEKLLFEEVEFYKSTSEIPNFEKLKGYRTYYKIRFGDYRVGLKLENSTLYFERILHRKDIYKFYP